MKFEADGSPVIIDTKLGGDASVGSIISGSVAETPKGKPLIGHLFPWILVIVVAAGLALLIRTYAIQTFYIPSQSMEPTLLVGDRILVEKLPWSVDNIHRGDIIVFRKVAKDPDTDADLVKRVIGLPGETIWSVGDQIYVNGKPISQPWLPNLNTPLLRKVGCPESAYNIPRTHIAAGNYFVMGDCREISYDSRYWGAVPSGNIVGKVVLVIWRGHHPWFHWF